MNFSDRNLGTILSRGRTILAILTAVLVGFGIFLLVEYQDRQTQRPKAGELRKPSAMAASHEEADVIELGAESGGSLFREVSPPERPFGRAGAREPALRKMPERRPPAPQPSAPRSFPEPRRADAIPQELVLVPRARSPVLPALSGSEGSEREGTVLGKPMALQTQPAPVPKKVSTKLPSFTGHREGTARVDGAVVCLGVQNREPVSPITEVSASAGQVYCWVRVAEGKGTRIRHIWTIGDEKVPGIWLSVGSHLWRTWGSKRLDQSMSGKTARVDVVDETGRVLTSLAFVVQ